MRKIFAAKVALVTILMGAILTGCNGNIKRLTGDERIAYSYVVNHYGEGDYEIKIDDEWTDDKRMCFEVFENGKSLYWFLGPRDHYTK